jgi:uncharacterized integral membrane protein
MGYVLVAIIAVGVTIFALQNTDPAIVRFLFWRLERVPIAALVLVSFGAGLLIALVPLAIRLGIWRSRARAREARVAMLEAAAEERGRQPLRPPAAERDRQPPLQPPTPSA